MTLFEDEGGVMDIEILDLISNWIFGILAFLGIWFSVGLILYCDVQPRRKVVHYNRQKWFRFWFLVFWFGMYFFTILDIKREEGFKL